MSRQTTRRVSSMLLFLCCAAPIRATENRAESSTESGVSAGKVRITILFNEALLIQSGSSSVLVDAFVEGPGSEGDSATVDKDRLTGLQRSMPIQLALVTHSHAEHFHPLIAGTFLKKHPETVLASSPEIIDAIRTKYPEYAAINAQLKKIRTDPGKITSRTLSGIQVGFIPFSHEASEFYPEMVLGHLIHLGGKKILVAGDAAMQPDNWQPYGLQSQGIDLALVPFWLFKEEATRTLLQKHVAPKKIVVVQIPSHQVQETIQQFSAQLPDVVLLSTSRASFEF